MKEPGCSHTESPVLCLCGQDRQVDSHGSREPSSDDLGLAEVPPAHTGSTRSCWRALWGEKNRSSDFVSPELFYNCPKSEPVSFHQVTCVCLTCRMDRWGWSGWKAVQQSSPSSAISWQAAWSQSSRWCCAPAGRSAVCASRHRTPRSAEHEDPDIDDMETLNMVMGSDGLWSLFIIVIYVNMTSINVTVLFLCWFNEI